MLKWRMIAASAALLMALTSVSLSGCVTAAAAAGTGAGVAYFMGDLEAVVDAPPSQVAAAARDALRDMNLAITSFEATELDGEIVARTARDTKVRIDIDRVSPTTSELSIRVGVFGDESLSRAIFERIQARLPAPAVVPE